MKMLPVIQKKKRHLNQYKKDCPECEDWHNLRPDAYSINAYFIFARDGKTVIVRERYY
jgi:hypothetical protein